MNDLSSLPFLVDTLNTVQNLRQSAGNRITHLKKQEKEDSRIEKFHNIFQSVEDSLVDTISPMVESHPTWKWGKRVKGVGSENLGKVIGLIEKVKKDNKCGVECFDTPSKLVRFCGLAVIDGRAEKKVSGEKLHYNSELRSMLWRLSVSLTMAKGKFYNYYLNEKDYLIRRYEKEGKKIIPTPLGRYCPNCELVVSVKTAKNCPDCGLRLESKKEAENIIFEGHLHNSALRRMTRMFLIMLYTARREELGLSVSVPYPVEHLGHSKIFTPQDFCE